VRKPKIFRTIKQLLGEIELAALFGSLAIDVLAAFFFGLLGGLGAELIGNKGNFEIPHKEEKHFIDTGFLANLLVGGIASLAIFYILDTVNPDPVKFIGISVTAGVGGTSILTALTEKLSGAIKEGVANTQSENAKDAINKLKDIAGKLNVQTTTKGLVDDTLKNLKDLAADANTTANVIEKSVKAEDERLRKLK
jgi:hypothetical protein